ncbi:MAG: tRNA (N(6)-L-threonylcarbamoyladenosine(37)-C(2))-methylthiotransferase MtaB [Lachnospiraceae bacterium]|nr:tRNA (N(6)-L-threonylcarbamoyladenosine(37)-C(2))-methylthiotransferase MtaB [Lachnospiraceae bacterium]
MKFYFHTLGCKVNQYESQEMRELARKHGYEITENENEADVFVINSCTVTAESDRKSRQQVRHYKRLKPDAVTVLTGCLPQSFPDMAVNLEEADIVLGNRNNQMLISAVEQYLKEHERGIYTCQHKSHESLISTGISTFDERTRADLKIEDGCDRFCSYCIIPKARGRVRSKSIEDIKEEVKRLADNGYREIVLVGINLSAYGKGTDYDLADAVIAVAENQDILRVRLSSLEPDHITEGLIQKLSTCDKLCPQFHISLQSGCDKILRLMNRYYTASDYFKLCTDLRKQFANCSITTDIMVGFPHENEEDFLETVTFAEKVGFEKIHIFPYSRRKGTKADEMDGQIEKSVKSRRVSILADHAKKIRSEWLKVQTGKTVNVLTEGKQKDGCFSGYTENYTPVIFTGHAEVGRIAKVLLTESSDDYCTGKSI